MWRELCEVVEERFGVDRVGGVKPISTRLGAAYSEVAASHSWRYKPYVNCLHVGNWHLADDALDLTHLGLRDVGPYVLAVRSALR